MNEDKFTVITVRLTDTSYHDEMLVAFLSSIIEKKFAGNTKKFDSNVNAFIANKIIIMPIPINEEFARIVCYDLYDEIGGYLEEAVGNKLRWLLLFNSVDNDGIKITDGLLTIRLVLIEGYR